VSENSFESALDDVLRTYKNDTLQCYHDGVNEAQEKIDELRESLKVCQRDYNSMIRLLNGLDNIAVRDCIGRMNLRKAMFKKSLEQGGAR
jgi:hypothetical protein